MHNAREILQNQNSRTPSTSTKKELLPSNITSTITSVKQGEEVRRIAYYLNELLKPDHDMLSIFMKYAWRYEEAMLVRLAITAKERDKRGNPAMFFNFLVREELGYKKDGF